MWLDEYKTLSGTYNTSKQMRKLDDKVYANGGSSCDIMSFRLDVYVKYVDGSVISYNNTMEGECEDENEDEGIQTEESIVFEKYRNHSEFTVRLETQDHEEDSDYSKAVFTFSHRDADFHKLMDFLHKYYMEYSPEYKLAYEKVSAVSAVTAAV